MESRSDLLGNRYQLLEKINAGGMGEIFRTIDRLSNETIALKRITVSTETLQFSSMHSTSDFRLALAQEFRTLASLRHPNIISVLDYGFDADKRPFFTMELLDRAQTIYAASDDRPFAKQLDLLLQATQALVYLHRRGVIHRDLKPDNILVVDDQVRVLDFGLAISPEDLAVDEETIAGTLAYLAPEILRGSPATPQSDLYALGVIAYEMFARTPPIDLSDPSQWVEQILNASPNLEKLAVNAPLTALIGRLLQKDPSERPGSAWEVLSELTALSGAAPESAEIRESFLQAAQFVGREAELGLLLDSFDEFMQAHPPTAWLIGGESGVGKSRLLDEFRVRALVNRGVVLRGQTISGGGHPYQLWLQIFRYLALSVTAESFEARVLKPLVSDIETLLGAPIRDAPSLDPPANRTRLITTIGDLLLRQGETVILVLEDLQWASHESLELIRALLRLKLMIVGSYRDDEAPELPAAFPMMQTIKLKRLNTDDIRALSMSILGQPGHNPEIVTLLQRETEGNVFFMVEAIRALAEEAGQLERIGQITLPAHIFAGGIQNLIQRRLGHLSETNIAILQVAAVIGRQIDLKLLAQIHPNLNLDQWLTESANAAVLEFFEEEWRFAHDKLREALLSLSEHRLKELHRTVAQAITMVYGKDRAAALAYHWGKAGDRAQEAYYSGLAGEMALHSGANQEAAAYLAKALAYEPSAMRERQMGQALYGLGQLKQAREHLQNAVALLNERLPDRLILGLISQLGKQIFHRVGIARPTQDRERTLEAARIYGLIGEICYFTAETTLGIYGVLRMLNLSERTTPSPELARAYANMCIAGTLVGQAGIAAYFSRRAEATVRELGDEIASMEVQNVRGVYLIGAGRWEQAQQALDEAFELAQALGDRREAIQSRTTLAISQHYQGNFAEAIALNEWAWAAAEKSGNTQQMGWGMYSKSENLLHLGEAAEALQLYLASYEILKKDIQTSSEIRVITGLALCHLQLDEIDKAEDHLATALSLLGKTAPNVYSMLDSYAAFAHVYLTLAECGIKTDFARIEAGCKLFRAFTKLYPIGRPRLLILEGRLAALRGKTDLAAANYAEAHTLAHALGMKYDQKYADQLKNG